MTAAVTTTAASSSSSSSALLFLSSMKEKGIAENGDDQYTTNSSPRHPEKKKTPCQVITGEAHTTILSNTTKKASTVILYLLVAILSLVLVALFVREMYYSDDSRVTVQRKSAETAGQDIMARILSHDLFGRNIDASGVHTSLQEVEEAPPELPAPASSSHHHLDELMISCRNVIIAPSTASYQELKQHEMSHQTLYHPLQEQSLSLSSSLVIDSIDREISDAMRYYCILDEKFPYQASSMNSEMVLELVNIHESNLANIIRSYNGKSGASRHPITFFVPKNAMQNNDMIDVSSSRLVELSRTQDFASDKKRYLTGECSAQYDIPTLPTPPDLSTPTTTVADAAQLQAAIDNASDGDIIYLKNGSYDFSSNLVINKQISIVGQSRDGVVIKDTRGNAQQFLLVSADNVVLQDLTVNHVTTDTNIGIAISVSGGGWPQTRIDNFLMYNVKSQYSKGGLGIRSDNFIVEGCTFEVVAGSSTRRGILHYGNGGISFIKDNVFIDNSGSGRHRAIYITSTSGSNPSDDLAGSLIVEGSTFPSPSALQQFIIMDNHQGGAGAFELTVKDNVTPETSGFIISYGGTSNYGDIFARVVIVGNTLTNSHEANTGLGKGVLAIDSWTTVSDYRSSPLEVVAQANTLGQLSFRDDYQEANGSSGSIFGFKKSPIFNRSPEILLCPFKTTDSPSVEPNVEPSVTPSHKPSIATDTPTKVPTRKPTRSPTPSPTPLPTSNPTIHPTPTPSKSPTQHPSPSPVETFAVVNLCGSCDELLVKVPFEQTVNSKLSVGTSATVIGSIPDCTSCGVSRNLASESISFTLKIIQIATVDEETPPPEPSQVVEEINNNSDEISITVSQVIGKDVEIDGKAIVIEAPSTRPSLSPAPSISYIPTFSQRPTQKYEPSARPTVSMHPSEMPTTAASRTFQILSSFKFDDSGREFCLNAMRIIVGRRLKMRPCRAQFRKQMWFIDDFNQLRLRQFPSYCARYRGKEIRLGKCNDDGSTKRRAQFFHDKTKGTLFVQKPKVKVYVGIIPTDKYAPVKLFFDGSNESLYKWSFK